MRGCCDRFCWGCRYYMPYCGGYCNFRYQEMEARGCQAGRGCRRRERVGPKRAAQEPGEPFQRRRALTDNEMEIVRLCAEAKRRGMSYGRLVWTLEGAELLEITQGTLWTQRKRKLLEAIQGGEAIQNGTLSPEDRRHIRELCASLPQGDAVAEYLLDSNDSAKKIAAMHYVSTSAIYAGAKTIIQRLREGRRDEPKERLGTDP